MKTVSTISAIVILAFLIKISFDLSEGMPVHTTTKDGLALTRDTGEIQWYSLSTFNAHFQNMANAARDAAKQHANTQAANGQRNSRRDAHDIWIGNKWFTGNNDAWIRSATGEGGMSYGNHGLAAHNLFSNGTVHVKGSVEFGSKTYTGAQVSQAIDLALNSMQKGTGYRLTTTNSSHIGNITVSLQMVKIATLETMNMRDGCEKTTDMVTQLGIVSRSSLTSH